MSDSLRELGDYIAGALGAAVVGTNVALGELTVEIRPTSSKRRNFCATMRTACSRC
jgi:hypothetical protein